jgi:hypothetical protein
MSFGEISLLFGKFLVGVLLLIVVGLPMLAGVLVTILLLLLNAGIAILLPLIANPVGLFGLGLVVVLLYWWGARRRKKAAANGVVIVSNEAETITPPRE